MKSVRLPSGSTYFAHEHNALRSDAKAASWLHVHQQLGALALGTTPSNNQTVTFDINGTNVVFTAVTGSPTNPGDVKAPGTAAGFVANLYAAVINPTVSTSTFIALSSANAILIQYLGWGLPSGGTTITPYSLNTSTYAPLTSFSASTTVTSGSWTANTLRLYVEPGTYYIGITRVLFLGGSTPTITAPSSHPRIDLVTADSSGAIALVTGSENVSPVAPTYPANKLVLAEIYNVVSETAIYDNDNQQGSQGYVLNDVRNMMEPVYISDPSQIADGTITAANLNATLGLIPSGSMVMWGTTSAPTGWLICDGSAVSRTTYSNLFGIISTTFGTGDGTTTFNLPDFRTNVPVGYKSGDANFGAIGATGGEVTHTLTSTEMPSHTHNYLVSGSGGSPAAGTGGTSGATAVATSSAGSGGAHNNLQPFITLSYIIKE